MYELGRIFRNEGISTRHNPEFTTVEVYQVRGARPVNDSTLAREREGGKRLEAKRGRLWWRESDL